MRSDLNWIFTVQTERVVAKDNTVSIGARQWQIDKTRFRNTLAGSTVTIHEHLDETVSIRFGPHVVGRYNQEGEKLNPEILRGGKGGSMEDGENQERVFHRLPPSLGNLAKGARFPLSHRADDGGCDLPNGQVKSEGQIKTQGAGGLTARRFVSQSGQITNY